MGCLPLLLAGLLAALATAPAAVASGPPAAELPRGEIVDPVPCLGDPTESYALYLPSSYDPERRWPVLFAFDARGRGALAARLFRDAAERFGWIVVSSNNSASDGPPEPNRKAVRALVDDTARRFSRDDRRLYLAGFSGTARFAWYLGEAAPGAFAGIFGASAGTPSGRSPAAAPRFPFFGTVGSEDFNFQEMRDLATVLDRLRAPARVDVFPGFHGWPPPALAEEALGFFEIQAMRAGTRPRDEDLARRLWTADLARAQELEAAGRPLWAGRLLASFARDFAGLVDTGPALAAAESLRHRASYRTREKEDAKLAAVERAYDRELVGAVQALVASPDPPPAAHLAARLGARRLRREAAGEGPRAESARRRLAAAYVQLSFYVERQLVAAGRFRCAAAALETARELGDDGPLLWYRLACAYARSGRRDDAVEALKTAADRGYRDLERLESDPDLEAIRGTDGYRAVVERLQGGPVTAPTPPAAPPAPPAGPPAPPAETGPAGG